MRILQFNNYADPIGGAEVYALALTRELAARGHEVGFFGTAPEREVDEPNLRVVRRPRYDAAVLFRDALVRQALQDYVARFRPELIHVHNVFSLGIDVLEALGACGVPLLQTVHDFSLLCPNSWCVLPDGTPCRGVVGAQCFAHGCEQNYPYDAEVALAALLKQRTLAGIVDLALCPSLHLAELTRASGQPHVRHLNYFIDPIPTDTTVARSAKELLFIGRMEAEKGVEHLLEAMPLVLRADPAVHLSIVGGGALAETLRARAAELGLGHAVTFIPHVPRSELGRYYSSATACVLPSVWTENSPLVAYECLFAGLPMLASRIGGIPELAEEGLAGFTFRPRDARDLAEKALRLLGMTSEERARMSAHMRAKAEGFRVGAHLQRIAELYAEARAHHGARMTRARGQVPIDGDLLAVLGEFAREKHRLGGYFREHEAYIRHLEQTLAAQGSSKASPEEHRRLIQELESSLAQHRGRLAALEGEGPKQLLRRLARALRLPKVFKG
ncbi:MAG: glycosyltransferase family 1 protein [Planctomycetes bacterium]|nr:glycosyltransferase family 1 protein [Planctomycetota bacterium]